MKMHLKSQKTGTWLRMFRVAAVLFVVLLNSRAFSQTLPVGIFKSIEDTYRRNQLLGRDSSGSSYMIRPLNISDRNNLLLNADSPIYFIKNLRKVIYQNDKLRSHIALLPIVLQQQYTTDHPYGINDGSMILSKGYQTQLSLGIYAKLGPLSIQFRPEYVYAVNKDFKKWYDIRSVTGEIISNPLGSLVSAMDKPERFGNGPYSRTNWGQSSIRLTFDPVSFGLSNENLWWGPGIRNSLLMTNNASGFKHLTLNTSRPVNTSIGSFEAQIVGGRLEPSGIPVPPGFKEKSSDWTYFSGVAFTYQPKWIPNLFLGFDRAFTVSRKNMGDRFIDYFPFFSAIEKAAYDIPEGGSEQQTTDDLASRDQYISIHARWILPESHSEIYFQYGRNDHAYDIRDFFVEPEHSRAYIAGFRKLVPLRTTNEFLEIGIEVSQIEGSQTGVIRPHPIWYRHGLVPNGYTNVGQLIGAGIGPGSNMQSLDVSWVKGLNKIGLQIERTQNNNDILRLSKSKVLLPWTDITFTGKFDWAFKRVLISSQFSYIRSLNYQYSLQEDKSFWNWDNQDVNNFQLKVGFIYLW